MGKTLAESVKGAKDLVDELWIEARVVYTESNIDTLKREIEEYQLSVESLKVRATMYTSGYPRIAKRELGRGYDALIDFHCLSARLAQLSGKEDEKEGHLITARNYQRKLRELFLA